MLLETCAMLFNVKLFVQTQFEKVGEHLDLLNKYLSKVNKTTFASSMFRVFLFSSRNKNLTDFSYKKFFVQATFVALVSRTFRKLDFFTVNKCRRDEHYWSYVIFTFSETLNFGFSLSVSHNHQNFKK